MRFNWKSIWKSIRDFFDLWPSAPPAPPQVAQTPTREPARVEDRAKRILEPTPADLGRLTARRRVGFSGKTVYCPEHGPEQPFYYVCIHLLEPFADPERVKFRIPPGVRGDGGGILCCEIRPELHPPEEVKLKCVVHARDLGFLPMAASQEVTWSDSPCGRDVTTRYYNKAGDLIQQDCCVVVEQEFTLDLLANKGA